MKGFSAAYGLGGVRARSLLALVEPCDLELLELEVLSIYGLSGPLRWPRCKAVRVKKVSSEDCDAAAPTGRLGRLASAAELPSGIQQRAPAGALL